jgi:hypothetical protein
MTRGRSPLSSRVEGDGRDAAGGKLDDLAGDLWTCFGKVESSPMSNEELDDAAATVYERI